MTDVFLHLRMLSESIAIVMLNIGQRLGGSVQNDESGIGGFALKPEGIMSSSARCEEVMTDHSFSPLILAQHHGTSS